MKRKEIKIKSEKVAMRLEREHWQLQSWQKDDDRKLKEERQERQRKKDKRMIAGCDSLGDTIEKQTVMTRSSV